MEHFSVAGSSSSHSSEHSLTAMVASDPTKSFTVKRTFSKEVGDTIVSIFPAQVKELEAKYAAVVSTLNTPNWHSAAASEQIHEIENLIPENSILHVIHLTYLKKMLLSWRPTNYKTRLQSAIDSRAMTPAPMRNNYGRLVQSIDPTLFKDKFGKPILIKKISPEQDPKIRKIHKKLGFDVKKVAPYVSPSIGYGRALQNENLLCRPLEAQDIRPFEEALQGQLGLFAKKDLPAKECIGVYGGTLLKTIDFEFLANMHANDYLMETLDHTATTPQDRYTCIDGDTLLSQANTTYAFDNQGRVQVDFPRFSGLNLNSASFLAELQIPGEQHTRKIDIAAYFTAVDVKAGQELRISYGSPSVERAEYDTGRDQGAHYQS